MKTNKLTTAINILNRVIFRKKNLDRELSAIATTKDKPLIQQLCYGVLREYFTLEAIVGKLLEKPLARKHPDLNMLLVLGIYQLRHLGIPQHAIVNDSVNCSKLLGKDWAKGLINGVLRNYLRSKASIDSSIDSKARLNHPDWLIDAISAAYPDAATDIMLANNIKAPMSLRVNLAKIKRKDYIELLEGQGLKAEPCPYAPTGVVLSEAVTVTRLPGFEQGLVSVQDEASQLAVPLLSLEPNLRVLDACAAPGGKTCHILESQDGLTELVSVEQDADRAKKIQSNLQRGHLSCKLLIEDFQSFSDSSGFERILLDPPCSATGIIRRHPDIKFNRQPGDIKKMAAQQLALLLHAWSLLAADGILVYTTCSILPEENQNVIAAFLDITPDAEIQWPNTNDNNRNGWGLVHEYGRILLPSAGGADGFFFSRLHKQKHI